MKDKLELYLDELVLVIKDAGAFAMEELPLFIQEYLTYYAWYHGIWAFALLLVSVPVYYLVYYHFKMIYRSCWNEVEWGLGSFLLGIVGVVLSVSMIQHFVNMLKVLIAPRVYLIENLTNLL